MDDGDLRVLAVLTTWLGVHHTHVNADRLVRLVHAHPSERVRVYWAAIATWLEKDCRLARLAGASEGAPIELLPTGTAFQIKRHGEDERFVGSPLRAPSGTLRDRPEDVLGPDVLVRRHAGYRNRVLMGPSFRADVWTVLEQTPGLSVAEVARRASCSFCYRVADGAGLPAAPRSGRDVSRRTRPGCAANKISTASPDGTR